MAQQEHELPTRLSKTEPLQEARSIVQELEKRFLYTWRAVGDNEANYGLINIGSDPGHALIERVTNALDSVIEAEALRRFGKKGRDALPASPREAVEMWFGIPGGRVANLGDPQKRQPFADKVVISLLDGRDKRHPSVMIR